MTQQVRVVVVTGVSGSGKTTVGLALARDLGWQFHDADDLHAPESIELMRRGVGLDDTQRQPWLLRVRSVIERAARGGPESVVACSALKEVYRQTLSDGLGGIRFVFLAAERALLLARLRSRPGHFAGPSLLDSQLAALEPPRDALVLDAALPVDELVRKIRRDVGR